MCLTVLVPHVTSVPDVNTAIPRKDAKSSSHKWNPKKFKEKMKAKFQSKVRGLTYFNIFVSKKRNHEFLATNQDE
jgi:hypothetical protein